MVGTADKEGAGEEKEAKKPEKGTPEELAQAKTTSASAQFGCTARKRAQESKSSKCPSLDEPVPKKPKAKLKLIKDAVADARLAAIDLEKDPLEDSDDEKETPETAKSSVAAFTVTAQDSPAPSATGKPDMVLVKLKTALSYGFTHQQLRDFDPFFRAKDDDDYDDYHNDEDDSSDIFDEDNPSLKLVKIPVISWHPNSRISVQLKLLSSIPLWQKYQMTRSGLFPWSRLWRRKLISGTMRSSSRVTR